MRTRVLGVGQALVHLSFHVLGRDNDLEFALQPFSERFDNLHFLVPSYHGGGAQTAVGLLSSTAPGALVPRPWLPLFLHTSACRTKCARAGDKGAKGMMNPKSPLHH